MIGHLRSIQARARPTIELRQSSSTPIGDRKRRPPSGASSREASPGAHLVDAVNLAGVGSRLLTMAGLPMQCPACGLAFEADNFIEAEPGSQITAVDCQVSCPRCGEMASQQQTGTFEVGPGGQWRLLVAALRPKEVTQADYRKLLETLEEARRVGAEPTEVVERVNRETPIFEDLGSWMMSQRGVAVAAWLAILIPIYGAASWPSSGTQQSLSLRKRAQTQEMPWRRASRARRVVRLCAEQASASRSGWRVWPEEPRRSGDYAPAEVENSPLLTLCTR